MASTIQRREQLGNDPPFRDDERGIELGERLEREATLVDTRMRYSQTRLVDDLVPVHQQVEIEGSRPPALTANPPELTLDAQERLQKLLRSERRLGGHGSVQEPRLLDDPDRVGLAERRDGDDLDLGFRGEKCDRSPKCPLSIPEVGSEADVRKRH